MVVKDGQPPASPVAPVVCHEEVDANLRVQRGNAVVVVGSLAVAIEEQYVWRGVLGRKEAARQRNLLVHRYGMVARPPVVRGTSSSEGKRRSSRCPDGPARKSQLLSSRLPVGGLGDVLILTLSQRGRRLGRFASRRNRCEYAPGWFPPPVPGRCTGTSWMLSSSQTVLLPGSSRSAAAMDSDRANVRS